MLGKGSFGDGVAFTLLALVVGSLAAPSLGQAAGEPRAREAWRYMTSQGAGGFVLRSGQRWRETTPEKNVNYFVETARTPDRVELRDSGRGMRLRLLADHCEFQWETDLVWRRLYEGGWTDRANVPSPPPKERGDYRIRVAYFVPSDRQAVSMYAAKIRVVMRLVGELYRSDLENKGYLPRDLELEEKEGHPVVHLVRGCFPASYYARPPEYDKQRQLRQILSEIPAEVAQPLRHLLLIFAETYDERAPAPREWLGALGMVFLASGTAPFVLTIWYGPDRKCYDGHAS